MIALIIIWSIIIAYSVITLSIIFASSNREEKRRKKFGKQRHLDEHLRQEELWQR